MQELRGPGNKVLDIDLKQQTHSVYTIFYREREMYLGGKGLGLKLLHDRLEPGSDPLGPKNILVVMPGVIMGTGAPCSGRFHALAKSPLTGIISTSSCGGPFGMQLKTAGWDGLILRGVSEAPVYLSIDSQGVGFHPAAELWGQEISRTQERIADKKSGSLVIGPAGENLVRFANIASGHRFLGRGGLGAVLGSKKVKAVLCRGGDYAIKPVHQARFDKLKKKGNRYLVRNAMTGYYYRNFGTRANVNPNNAYGILPVRNFRAGSHDRAHHLSGETMRETHAPKPHTCIPCSILCGHKGSFDGRTLSMPEYETVTLMGSNLGIFDSAAIAEWNRICGETGLDTISTGATLGFVMEAAEKGLIDSRLRFGSKEGVEEAIQDIAHARGLGAEMGQGTRYLSEHYGGEDFAIQVKGLEMAGYDPRGSYGQGLAHAVANRGACHLSAYMVALERYFHLLEPYTTRAKPELTIFLEALTNCINSLQTCQFTMFAYLMEPPQTRYTPNPVQKLIMQNLPRLAMATIDFSLYTQLYNAVTGYDLSNSRFLEAGHRIHLLERSMNCKEGIDASHDTLPPRMLRDPLETDPEGRHTVPLGDMLDEYYRLRGYEENGKPSTRVLNKYGIAL